MDDLEPISLGRIAAAALDARTAAVSDQHLVVRTTLGDADVVGNQTLLTRMVANVIDNAVSHNEPNGLIAVTTSVEGPAARLVVESGGARLDPRDVQRLADPFRRLGADRTGSDNGVGLGLSIVAAIAAAHGGTLELSARAEGGLRVAVELPRQAPSSNDAPR
jgi:hypothetical protein